ncbi:hypothetical protein [Streptomyces sp. MH60]|uniref:hypothetical protein n=1 Tax=Streptomyces sp. MH60 TaxID=1940758 RepID=UPI001056F6E8|nr:hypothetical protein [Streptomyces sp. MH60]
MPTPEAGPVFVPGPPVRPTQRLLEWLNETAGTAPGRLVRLPVEIRLDAQRLGIDAAVLGVGTSEDDGPDSIRLTLNDGAMGVPLAGRVRALCPPGGHDCVVWLDGYWGLPGGAFSQTPRPEADGAIRAVFSPVSVGDAVTPGRRPEDVHALVEQ